MPDGTDWTKRLADEARQHEEFFDQHRRCSACSCDEWADDDTPPYSYVEHLRERFAPVIQEAQTETWKTGQHAGFEEGFIVGYDHIDHERRAPQEGPTT